MALPNILESVFGRMAPRRADELWPPQQEPRQDDPSITPVDAQPSGIAPRITPRPDTLAPIADEYGDSVPVPEAVAGSNMPPNANAPSTSIDLSRFQQIVPQVATDAERAANGSRNATPTPDSNFYASPDNPTGDNSTTDTSTNVAASPYSAIRPVRPEDEKDPLLRQNRLMTEGASRQNVWKRLLHGALQGLAGGGLGGAILGAIAEGASPRFNQKIRTRQELNDTNRQIAMRDAAIKEQQDSTKRDAENRGLALKNEQGLQDLQYNAIKNDPIWEQIKPTQQMTKAQADYLNKKAGTSLFTAGYWGGFEEYTDPATGARMIRPKNDPRYSVNPTISPDVTVPPISVNAGGIPMSLKGHDIAGLMESENNANAGRAEQTAIHNSTQAVEVAKANAAQTQAYNSAILKNRSDVIAQYGKGLENVGEVNGLNAQLQAAGDRVQRAGAAITYDSNGAIENTKENERAVKEFNDAQADFGVIQAKTEAALGKTNAGVQLLQQIQSAESQITRPKPISTAPVSPVQTHTVTPAGTSKLITKAAIKKAAKDHGTSYSEAARQAKEQGFTIQ